MGVVVFCVKKKPKTPTYRIRNWKEYNTALAQRGSLTVWIDPGALAQWTSPCLSGKRGRPTLYHDLAIITALTLSSIFRLRLRQTKGFLASFLGLMSITLPVPDSSTLCRRRKALSVPIRSSKKNAGKPRHIVVDSTGLKVYGDGEWKVRQHGYSKRRTWRKLHLAVDEATGEKLTGNDTHDGEMLFPLLDRIEDPIKQVSADGAYDSHATYGKLKKRKIRTTIPPRRDARIKKHGNSKGEKSARDEVLRRIRQIGRKQRKKKSGYHRRSLAETMMFRYKTIFGDRLSARRDDSQRVEAAICCRTLNIITGLGMPKSYPAT